MSKNIKLIAGAGLAVAAASMASVSSASAISYTDLLTGLTANDSIIISANSADNNINNGIGGNFVKMVTGKAVMTADVRTDANDHTTKVNTLYININGHAEINQAFATRDNVNDIDVVITVAKGATLDINAPLTLADNHIDVINNGTVNVNGEKGGAIHGLKNELLKNNGTFNINNLNWTLANDYTNRGIMNISGSTIIISAGTQLTNLGTVNVMGTGVLAIADAQSAIYASANGKTYVYGKVTIPTNASTYGNFTLMAIPRTDAKGNAIINAAGTGVKVTASGRIDSANNDIKDRVFNGMKDVLTSTGAAGVDYTWSIDYSGSYIYRLTNQVAHEYSIRVDDDETMASGNPITSTVYNDHTTLKEYVDQAFKNALDGATNGDDIVRYLGTALAAAGVENVSELTEDQISAIVSNYFSDKGDHVDYNYFEGFAYNPIRPEQHMISADTVINDVTTFNTGGLVLYAQFSKRNVLQIYIENGHTPIFLGNVYAKVGAKYTGEVVKAIQSLLDAYNKNNGTKYTINSINVDRLIGTDVMNAGASTEVSNYDKVYLKVTTKAAAKPASTKKPAATTAAVLAPNTGAISEAASTASSSNIFATVMASIVALGAAVAKLFKKSER